MALSPKTRRRLECTIGNSALAKELADSVDASVRATSGPINLYVDVNGSDTNPTTPSGPFKTIQAAINTLPKLIQHPVTVNVGAGNFAGFVLSGFRTSWDGVNLGSLAIIGTLVPAVGLTTGTNSGTVTARAIDASNPSGVTFTTVTDSGQSWTVNELIGRFLFVPSANSYGLIISNTATVITLAGRHFANSATVYPNVADAYQILEHGTIITSATGDLLIPREPTQNGAGVWVTNNNTYSYNGINGTMSMHNLKIAPQSGKPGIKMEGHFYFGLNRCTVAPTAAVGIQNHSGAALSLFSSRIVAASGQIALSHGFNGERTAMGINIESSSFEGGTIGIAVGNCVMTCNRSQLINQTTAGIAPSIGAVSILLNFNKFSCPGASGIMTQFATRNDMSPLCIMDNGNQIDNCTTAIKMDHPNAVCNVIDGSGSGNTTGISAAFGARIRVNAATTRTGTTELSLDGTASTLATMRAASPKLLNNTYGTLIYQ